MKKILLGLFFSIFCGLNLFGGDYELGAEAYKNDNYAKAFELYKKACDVGNLNACTELGFLFEKGIGCRQDHFKAAALFKKSCDGGDFLACYNLAINYQSGLGVVQDYSEAHALYKKSCFGNYLTACVNLG